ncbi:hypothetical protein AAC387_Pa01g4312 [Persea americana]
MTTAYTAYKNGEQLQDIATGKASTPFDYGAGHVNPLKALDPGLIYDLTTDDYMNFLCALNYTPSQIAVVSNRNFTCSESVKYSVADLNYPSFAVPFTTGLGSGGNKVTVLKYTRTLTNVGASGTYKVSASFPSGSVKIAVEPAALSFSQMNEKKMYTVSFSASSMPSGTKDFGRLQWTDGNHVVGSPIAVTWT